MLSLLVLCLCAPLYRCPQVIAAFPSAPLTPACYHCLQGGFQAEMSKREAALILGLRESAAADRVKEAHRRIMIANHPDSGGSSFLATKVNEAKDLMLGKGRRRTGSAF